MHMFLYYKTGYLIEEVNCNEPFPSIRVPWYELLEMIIRGPSVGQNVIKCWDRNLQILVIKK